jgi:hypothetical protein
MKANYFGDFPSYAEINGELFELTPSHFFSRNVRRYKDSYCMVGTDFVHPDRNINPCIKIPIPQGAHLLTITLHHIRPYTGVSTVSLMDDSGNVLVRDTLLPGNIFRYEIKLHRSIPSDVYLTISATELTHATVRTLVTVTETDFSGSLEINLHKSHWVVEALDMPHHQTVPELTYDADYKY